MNNIELIEMLINEIGLYVNENNEIVDQDFGTVLNFNQKTLKYPLDGNMNFNPREDEMFTPFTNIKLMTKLFNYYLDKINRLEGKYTVSFYQYQDPNDMQKRAMYANVNGVTLKSKFYYNHPLRYLDLILTIGGYTDVDLSMYDIIDNSKKVI